MYHVDSSFIVLCLGHPSYQLSMLLRTMIYSECTVFISLASS